jgi:hypothetical protein
MNSAAEQDETRHSISPFAIGMIVISVVAGIGLLGISFLLIRRILQRNRETSDVERNNGTSKSIMKQVFSINKQHQSDIPVTSSLDNSDVFYTILEYPPTVQTTVTNSLKYNNHYNSSKLLYSSSSYPEKKIDPISMSLARQSLEERAGYYKSPTRTPVPYYSSSSTSEPLASKNTFKSTDDQDDDMKTMQRWSTCSYQVW